MPGDLYQPLLIGRLLPLPTPTETLVTVIFWALLLLALLAATGRAPRLLGWAVCALYLEWMIIAMSYGKVDHDRFGLLVALAVLPTAGRARHGDTTRTEAGGWALRVTQIAVICTYFLAAWAKLRFGGLDWLTGSVLARAIIRRGTDLADLIAQVPYLLIVAQFGIVAFELLSPMVFFLPPRWRLAMVGFFYSFHVVTIATITISFAPHLAAMTSFLPLERVRPLVWARRTDRPWHPRTDLGGRSDTLPAQDPVGAERGPSAARDQASVVGVPPGRRAVRGPPAAATQRRRAARQAVPVARHPAVHRPGRRAHRWKPQARPGDPPDRATVGEQLRDGIRAGGTCAVRPDPLHGLLALGHGEAERVQVGELPGHHPRARGNPARDELGALRTERAVPVVDEGRRLHAVHPPLSDHPNDHGCTAGHLHSTRTRVRIVAMRWDNLTAPPVEGAPRAGSASDATPAAGAARRRRPHLRHPRVRRDDLLRGAGQVDHQPGARAVPRARSSGRSTPTGAALTPASTASPAILTPTSTSTPGGTSTAR